MFRFYISNEKKRKIKNKTKREKYAQFSYRIKYCRNSHNVVNFCQYESLLTLSKFAIFTHFRLVYFPNA